MTAATGNVPAAVIQPSVGRVVWYWPVKFDIEHYGISVVQGQPLCAQIVCVWGASCVNLVIWDHNGKQFTRTSVMLRQPGISRPNEDVPFCEWMPYQIRQSAKHGDIPGHAAEQEGLTVPSNDSTEQS